MDKSYLLLQQAVSDMAEIVGYIAERNPAAARKMKDLFIQACLKLGDNPNIGHQRRDLTNKNVRFWSVYRNYMIIYNAETKPVHILRIYNSARNITSVLN